MNPLLLLVGLLLLVWLMVRMARKTDAPAWLKSVRVLLLLAAVLIGLYYGWFRIQRATADVDRARGSAKEILRVMDRYEADKDIASAVVSPFISRGVVDSVEALADLANDGDLGKLRRAAQDARYCLAEVGRDLGPLELLIYTQPTPCRAMFETLGEPGELADAGVTFGDAAARVSAKQRPGEPGGPACHEWKVSKVEVTLPKTKNSGAPWDIGGGKPDPVIALRVGTGQWARSPVTRNQHKIQWAPTKPMHLTPGSKLQVHVHDSDPIEDDFAFGYEVEVPQHAGTAWVVGRSPQTVILSLDCAR